MRRILIIFLLFTFSLEALELRVVRDISYIETKKAQITSIERVIFETDDPQDMVKLFASVYVGALSGDLLTMSLTNFRSTAGFGAIVGSLMALSMQDFRERSDAYELRIRLESGQIIYLLIPITMNYLAGDRIKYIETNKGRSIKLDDSFYVTDVIETRKSQIVRFSQQSVTPDKMRTKCNRLMRKANSQQARAKIRKMSRCLKGQLNFSNEELEWLWGSYEPNQG